MFYIFWVILAITIILTKKVLFMLFWRNIGHFLSSWQHGFASKVNAFALLWIFQTRWCFQSKVSFYNAPNQEDKIMDLFQKVNKSVSIFTQVQNGIQNTEGDYQDRSFIDGNIFDGHLRYKEFPDENVKWQTVCD